MRISSQGLSTASQVLLDWLRWGLQAPQPHTSDLASTILIAQIIACFMLSAYGTEYYWYPNFKLLEVGRQQPRRSSNDILDQDLLQSNSYIHPELSLVACFVPINQWGLP
jgi:hypothetical protein